MSSRHNVSHDLERDEDRQRKFVDELIQSLRTRRENGNLPKNVAPISKGDLKAGLRRIGLQKGDTVLVHCSLSSFGHVRGGADTVIDAVLEVVGKEGTVMVPTITGTDKNAREKPPYFDVCKTPCWTGKIPEVFRKRKEAIRSLHPTHSVAAIGKKANWLTQGHEKCITPCGKDSPYVKLTQLKGYILFLGIGLGSNTSCHAAEEMVNHPIPDYHLQKEIIESTIVDYQAKKRKVRGYIHRWCRGARDFSKVEPILLEAEDIKTDKIGEAIIRLVDAQEMLRLLLARLNKEPEWILREEMKGKIWP